MRVFIQAPASLLGPFFTPKSGSAALHYHQHSTEHPTTAIFEQLPVTLQRPLVKFRPLTPAWLRCCQRNQSCLKLKAIGTRSLLSHIRGTERLLKKYSRLGGFLTVLLPTKIKQQQLCAHLVPCLHLLVKLLWEHLKCYVSKT